MTDLTKVFFDYLFVCVPCELKPITIKWFNSHKKCDLSEAWETVCNDLTDEELSLAFTLQMTIAVDAVVKDAEKYRQLKLLLKD